MSDNKDKVNPDKIIFWGKVNEGGFTNMGRAYFGCRIVGGLCTCEVDFTKLVGQPTCDWSVPDKRLVARAFRDNLFDDPLARVAPTDCNVRLAWLLTKGRI